MTEKLKVSIQLNLEIPVKTDEAGRRISPTNLVAPYIDRLINDMRYEGMVPVEVDSVDWEGYTMPSTEDYVNLADVHFGTLEEKKAAWKKSEPKRDLDATLAKMWLENQERICQHTYGMSWDAFKALPNDRRTELAVEKGVSVRLQQSLEVGNPYGIQS